MFGKDFSDVKIIDFGFATKTNQYLKECCGTDGYMAPEIVLYKPYDGH